MSLTAVPSTDYPLAVATMTVDGNAASKVSVTFFAIASHMDIIRYNAPVGPGETPAPPKLQDQIGANQAVSAFSWYSWNSAQGNIFWGTTNGAAISNSADLLVTTTSVAPTERPTLSTEPTSASTTGILSTPDLTESMLTATTISSDNGTTPTTVPTRTPESKGIPRGGVAGIAIGCLVAGALIAGLLVWFCTGRSRKKRTSPDHEASAIALMNRDKGSTAKALSLESSSPMSLAIESGLPQPLEDKAISDEISKISNLIKNHVQSYYHSGRVSPGLLDLDDIQAFGGDLPISTGTLSTLLSNSETRDIALRFCLAWVIISRMQLKSGPAKTLLPPEVADCFQSMAFVDRMSPGKSDHE